MKRTWIIVIIVIVVIILFFAYRYFNKPKVKTNVVFNPNIQIPRTPVVTVAETANTTSTEKIESETANETVTETQTVNETQTQKTQTVQSVTDPFCNSLGYRQALALKAIAVQESQSAFDKAKSIRLSAKTPNPVHKMTEDSAAKKLKIAQDDYMEYYSKCNK